MFSCLPAIFTCIALGVHAVAAQTNTTLSEQQPQPCSLCPAGEQVPKPNKALVFWNTTCSSLDAFLRITYAAGSAECVESQVLVASLCGCSTLKEDPCVMCPNGEMTMPEARMFGPSDELGFAPTCELIESYARGDVDADSHLCALFCVYNFRCGCSNVYGFVNEPQYRAAEWSSRVSGFLSLVGSSYIIFDIIRDKEKLKRNTYHQILLLMSCVDVLSSTAFVFGPVPAPKYDEYGLWTGNLGAIGNEATCNAQGFFIQFGITAGFYNVSLCFFYLLTIVHSWRENQIKKVKFCLLGFPIIVGLVLAYAGIPFFEGSLMYCAIPPAREWKPAVVFVTAPLSLVCFLVTALMVKIYLHVRKTEHNANRWRAQSRPSDIPSEHNASRWRPKRFLLHFTNREKTPTMPSRQQLVFREAVFYLLGFYLSWPIFLVSLNAADTNLPYGFHLCAAILIPLQGVHNFLVYARRHRVKRALEKKAARIARWRSTRTTAAMGSSARINVAAAEARLPSSRPSCNIEDCTMPKTGDKMDVQLSEVESSSDECVVSNDVENEKNKGTEPIPIGHGIDLEDEFGENHFDTDDPKRDCNEDC